MVEKVKKGKYRMVPQQKPGRSKQDVGTPEEFLIAVRRRLGIESFAWDLAATKGVNECSPFGCYSLENDALEVGVQGWIFPGWCWLNPPFGTLGPWVALAADAGAIGGQIAVLVPAGVGSNWWTAHVDGHARVLLLNGRITFVGESDPYPKDCCLLLYGSDVVPGYETWPWMDTLTEQERENMAKRIKAEKAPKVRAMAGKTTRAAQPVPGVPGRVTTFKPNGATSMGVASDPDEETSAILLPTPEDSVRLLGELATMNDRAKEAQRKWTVLRDATKDAKEKYDELAAKVLARLSQGTHKSGLPLFADVEQREQDQAKMEAAGSAAASDPPAERPESPQDESGGPDEGEIPPSVVGSLEGEQAGGMADEDDIPF